MNSFEPIPFVIRRQGPSLKRRPRSTNWAPASGAHPGRSPPHDPSRVDDPRTRLPSPQPRRKPPTADCSTSLWVGTTAAELDDAEESCTEHLTRNDSGTEIGHVFTSRTRAVRCICELASNLV